MALQIAKNGDTEDRKAKEQTRAEKVTSERIRALQTAQKRAGWKMAQVNSVKKSHSEERKEPYIRDSSHTK